jgi:hypothetical protein
MVIVIVRNEYLTNSAKRHPRQSELPSDAVSSIDDVRFIVDDKHVSRLCTIFVWHGTALCTQRDQYRICHGLLGDRTLRQRHDTCCEVEDKPNRQGRRNGGSRSDHAIAPEEAFR